MDGTPSAVGARCGVGCLLSRVCCERCCLWSPCLVSTLPPTQFLSIMGSAFTIGIKISEDYVWDESYSVLPDYGALLKLFKVGRA